MGKYETLTIFQELYDSEINFEISTFWDGGFTAKLGDEQNGFKAERICKSMMEAAEFLEREALIYFPHSIFAEWR